MPPEPNLAGAAGGNRQGGSRSGRRRPLRAGGSSGLGLAFDTSGVRDFTREMGKASEAVEKLFAPFKDIDKLDKKLDDFFKGIKTNLTQVKEQSDNISFDFGTGTGAGGGMYAEHQQSVSQMTERSEQMRGGGGGGGGLLAGLMGGPGRQAAGFALGTTAGFVSTMGPGVVAMDTAANLFARQGGYDPATAERIRRDLPQVPGTFGRQDTAAAARTLRAAGVGPDDLFSAQRGVGGLVQTVPGLTAGQAAQTAAGIYSAPVSNQLLARGIMTSPGGRERPVDEIMRDVVTSMFPGQEVTQESLERLRTPGTPERLRLAQLLGSDEAAGIAVEQTQIQANVGGGRATRGSALPRDLSPEDRLRAGMDETLEERTRQLTEEGLGATENIAEEFRTSLKRTIEVQTEVVEWFGKVVDESEALAFALGNLGGTVSGLGGVLGTFRGAIDTVINLLILRRVGGLAGGAAAAGSGGAGAAGRAGLAGGATAFGGGLLGGAIAGGLGAGVGIAELGAARATEQDITRMDSERSYGFWARNTGLMGRKIADFFNPKGDTGDPVPMSELRNLPTAPGSHVNSMSAVWNWRQPADMGDPVLRGPGRDTGMNADFVKRLKQMFADNPKLSLTSGFRSTAEQSRLYARWKARVPGQAPAAPPGRSNHEKGTAADIGPRSEYGWLAANAPKYGLKKPMSYEPWHWEPSNAVGGSATAPPSDQTDPGAATATAAAPAVSSLRPLEASLLSGLPGAGGAAAGGGAEGVVGGAGPLTDANASQTDIIKKIVEVGQSMGASPKAILAAVETGWMETGMRNLRGGDRDSLGVFQQRPSQGWGTPEQILDVAFAARSFLSRAMKVDLPTAGQVAAAVQRPAARYRHRYQQKREQAVASLATVGFDARGVAGDPIPAGGGWSHPVPSAGTGAMASFPSSGGNGSGLFIGGNLTVRVELARGSIEEAERFGRHFSEILTDRARNQKIGSE